MTNVMAYMLVVGLSGLLRLRARFDRLWSWLMFIVLCCLFGEYYIQNANGNTQNISILWGYSQLGDIMIDFHPTQITNQLILPLFSVLLIVVFNNNIFRFEEKRSAVNGFIVLNFIAILLLICAENYVQLITMVFISDIMGYMILKDADSSHRYVVYNFFADMCLFMILALACGKIQSLDMNRLLGYEQIGRHKDFVSLITALALFIKLGCFPFQSYLLDISSERFQRTTVVSLLSAPLVGILLLLKLHNLLLISNIFLPLFKTLSWLTIFWGVSGFITRNNLQKKIVCLNSGFLGLLMLLLAEESFSWNNMFSVYYIAVCLFNEFMVQIYFYKNRETDMIKILNGKEGDTRALKGVLIEITFLSALFMVLMLRIYQSGLSEVMLLPACMMIGSLSLVLNHVYKPILPSQLNYKIATSMQKLAILINICIMGMMMQYIKAEIWEMILVSLAFLGLMTIPFGKYFSAIYENAKLQDKDLSKSFFFYTLVAPFTYISRSLWLLIDFYLSEKIIASNLALLSNFCTTVFLKINRRKYSTFIVFFILGIVVLIISYYRGQL